MTEATTRSLETRFGERLRTIRRRRRETLRAVAERAGISDSFLSQVERSVASPRVASLQRIAGALGAAVSDLFEPDGAHARPRVLRKESRPVLPLGTRGRKFLLTPRPLDNLEVFTGELQPGAATAESGHPDEKGTR